MSDCQWPFCHVQDCSTCREWETAHGASVDHYLAVLAETRAAVKAARHD